MIRSLVKGAAMFVLERSGIAELLRQHDVADRSPMFRMYYDLARNAGATHQSSMRYAKYWADFRSTS